MHIKSLHLKNFRRFEDAIFGNYPPHFGLFSVPLANSLKL